MNALHKVGIFVTHPVQYHVPIWRHLAEHTELEVNVYYFSRQGIENRIDPGFGKSFQWDQDLLSGYNHRFLADVGIPEFGKVTIPDPAKVLADLDVVLLHGYTHAFARQVIRNKSKYGYKVVLRGEFSDRVTRSRNWSKSLIRNAYLKWFYSRVDAFAYVGRDAQAHLTARGVPSHKQFFSPYAVDAEYFQQQREQTSRDTARQQLRIPEDRVVFLFSGKMIERKRPHFMAQVAREVGQDPRFHLIMLGDGPLLDSTRSLLAPLMAEGRALLPGFVNQSELARYFRAADAFVFPSAGDTWGLVANEAMHFGLPCIISDQVGCGPDLIIPGETGEVLPSDEVEAWNTCLGKYLAQPALLAQMGRNASNRIKAYTPAQAASGIVQAINYVNSAQHQSV